MKHIQLFENFDLNEGWMSEIDAIAQESPNRESFKEEVKKFLKGHKNYAEVSKDEFLEGLAKTAYDGRKDESEILESDSAEIASVILGNRKLRGDITEILNDTHAFLIGSQKRVNNNTFKEAIDSVVKKIIDSWEF